MRYLVTGGAGFIGSHIVEHLVSAGEDVVVLDDLSTGRAENIAAHEGHLSLIHGSITDPGTCARACDGVDYVFHQAAIPSVPRSIAHPHATHEACVTGTLNMLVAARDAHVKRLVYAASSSAYGDFPDLPRHEDMPVRPLSPYAAAKLAAEHYCKAFTDSYGFETVALRYFNIFGPRQDPTSQYSAVVPTFIQYALEGQAPVIHGDGEQTRDFTFVENVVNANLAAATAPAEAAGKVFNIGCGERTSVNQLWSKIRDLVGTDARATHGPPRAGDVRESLAALDRAEALLGYRVTVDLDEGLRRTVEFFRSWQPAGVG